MVKIGIETVDNVADEVLAVHGSAEATEAICRDLHVGAIIEQDKITLIEIAGFCTKVERTGVLVVMEERVHTTPEE